MLAGKLLKETRFVFQSQEWVRFGTEFRNNLFPQVSRDLPSAVTLAQAC